MIFLLLFLMTARTQPTIEGGNTAQDSAAAEFIHALQEQRGVLRSDPRLQSAAQQKAQDMADYKPWRLDVMHKFPWANNLAREYGYQLPDGYRPDANHIESLYRGGGSGREVLEALLASETHRAHVLGEGGFASQNTIGVGHSGDYWVILIAPGEDNDR